MKDWSTRLPAHERRHSASAIFLWSVERRADARRIPVQE